MPDADPMLAEIEKALRESQALWLKLKVAEGREIQIKAEAKAAIEKINHEAERQVAEETRNIIEASKAVAEAKQTLIDQQKDAKARLGIDINLLMAQPAGGSTRL